MEVVHQLTIYYFSYCLLEMYGSKRKIFNTVDIDFDAPQPDFIEKKGLLALLEIFKEGFKSLAPVKYELSSNPTTLTNKKAVPSTLDELDTLSNEKDTEQEESKSEPCYLLILLRKILRVMLQMTCLKSIAHFAKKKPHCKQSKQERKKR